MYLVRYGLLFGSWYYRFLPTYVGLYIIRIFTHMVACTTIVGCSVNTCTNDSDQQCISCNSGRYLSGGVCPRTFMITLLLIDFQFVLAF